MSLLNYVDELEERDQIEKFYEYITLGEERWFEEENGVISLLIPSICPACGRMYGTAQKLKQHFQDTKKKGNSPETILKHTLLAEAMKRILPNHGHKGPRSDGCLHTVRTVDRSDQEIKRLLNSDSYNAKKPSRRVKPKLSSHEERHQETESNILLDCSTARFEQKAFESMTEVVKSILRTLELSSQQNAKLQTEIAKLRQENARLRSITALEYNSNDHALNENQQPAPSPDSFTTHGQHRVELSGSDEIQFGHKDT